MSNEFEWKTEEDAGWEEEIAVPVTRPSRSFPWKIAGLLLLGLLVIWGGARWQVNRQVNSVTSSVEQDVQTAHRFLQRVAAQQDVELVKSLISGRDPEWSAAQKTLVTEGWFGNPPLLAWTAVPLAAGDPLTVTLSPDLSAAEVQSERSFHLLNPQGITETVTLRQTAVYRKGSDRWLFAPPEDEFWGETAVYEGEYVTAVYPVRDEEVVLRLAEDLDTLVAAICQEIAPCPYSSYLQIRFRKEPFSLLEAADQFERPLPYGAIHLPTPTLIGLPVDEAAYQALFRAYGTQVATYEIRARAGYNCCRLQLLFRSMLDRQLYQLGLRSWPLHTAVYEQLAVQPLIGGVSRLLINRPSFSALDQMHLYAFVEFLESAAAPGVTLADMQRSLDQPSGVTDWANQFVVTPFAHNAIDQAFFRHVIQQAASSQVSRPLIPQPDTVRLLCNVGPYQGRVSMHEYDLPTESWHTLFTEENTPFWAYAQPLPFNPSLTLLIEFLNEDDRLLDAQSSEITYFLLENGSPLASFTLGEGPQNFYMWGGDPHGRYLMLGRWYDNNAPDFRLLDVAACREGDCQPQPVAGLMVWSPDGRQTLITSSEDLERDDLLASPLLWLGEATGQYKKVVGVGDSPFWLNNTTYGYLQTDETGWQEWVTAVVGEDVPRRLLSADELLAAIPEAERPKYLFMNVPVMVANKPDQLYMQASASSTQEQIYYLFAVTLTSDRFEVQDVTLLYQSNSSSWVDLSPDGRWLVIHNSHNVEGTAVTLRPLETGEEQQLPLSQTHSGLSWSQDSRWYVRSGNGYMVIGAPDYNYKQYVFHDFGECGNVYWIE